VNETPAGGRPGGAPGAPPGAPPGPMVWIVIPAWNGCRDTVECLASLRRLTWPRQHVLVVDNGSADGTADVLAARFPAVEVLRLERNLGFTGGCNLGLRYAFGGGADYVLLLNNDTVVHPDVVGELLSGASAWPRQGLFSPLILYHADPDVVWYGGGQVDLTSGLTAHAFDGSSRPPLGPFRTQWANGCACLISRRAYETLGGLDPAYFASYEDVDLSLRARRSGMDAVVVPAARVWHKVSVSWRGQGQFYFYTVRNRLYFVRKFSGPGAALWWSLRLGAGALAYAAGAGLRRRSAEAKMYLFTLGGVLAFLSGSRGRAPEWVYRWGRI